MNAAAIINEIEGLPIEEQRKRLVEERDRLLQDVQLLEHKLAAMGESNERVDAEFRKVADEVFTRNAELFRKLAQ